ncbi:MAG: AAA family ATPase [Burkholderiales bacterium]
MADEQVAQKIKINALRLFPERPIADPRALEEIFSLWAGHQRFLILAGPPGVGKTRAAEDTIQEVIKRRGALVGMTECRVTELFPHFRTRPYSESDIRELLISRDLDFVWDLCVMHPQITYEDLIRGYRMVESSVAPKIEVREGILGFASRVTAILEGIKKADGLPRSLLVLDEINRAPLGQVLGEAIYALDRRGVAVATPYALPGASSLFSLPAGMMILGTMNSVDRAISGFDFALRRRFATVYLSSTHTPIEKRFAVFSASIRDTALGMFENVKRLVANAKQTGVVPTSELLIGHSYFLPPEEVKTDADAFEFLVRSILYQVVPTLIDYQEQGLLEYQAEELERSLFGDLLGGQTALANVSSNDIRDRMAKGFLSTGAIT